MRLNAAVIVLALQESEGLTFGEVLSSIPRDPAAIVVYVMLIGSAYAIWKYGRGSGGASGGKA
jgi:hypothetical protein